MKILPTYYKSCLASVVVVMILSACNRQPGFDCSSADICSRLDKFGDCEPSLFDAAHFIMQVRFQSLDHPDKKYEFQLHHHSLHTLRPKAGEDSLSSELTAILLELKCGDAVTLRLPFHHFDRSFLSAYADDSMYDANEQMELSLEVLHTFEAGEYANFLMSGAQQGEIPESEAIELLLMNEIEQEYEKHGDCFIQYFTKGHGDTLAVGDEITMTLNTFLLNGKKLDEQTEMQFNYGMPGQILDGLHYALSFMTKGDEAMVYLPSYLAFGPAGSSGSVVPRNTPVYFRIKLAEPTR
jgi:FKBP-type peptidyl-prolyl cis-trans isomerase FklB